MSLKSKPLVIEGTFTEVKVEDPPSKKADCWCSGRNMKLHKVGDPFCHFPVTYKVPEPIKHEIVLSSTVNSSTTTPVTFDEDLIMSCINRAIAKTPPDFVSMLEEGRVNQTQARRINNELRYMGYCISEEPF